MLKSFLMAVLLSASVERFGVARMRDVLLLPDKVYSDAINELQYSGAKMQKKSEMHVKYGHANFLKKNLRTKTAHQ